MQEFSQFVFWDESIATASIKGNEATFRSAFYPFLLCCCCCCGCFFCWWLMHFVCEFKWQSRAWNGRMEGKKSIKSNHANPLRIMYTIVWDCATNGTLTTEHRMKGSHMTIHNFENGFSQGKTMLRLANEEKEICRSFLPKFELMSTTTR